VGTYLVAGGTSGIGLETTKLLSRENKVIVISREKKNLDGLDNVEFYSADIKKSGEELPQLSNPIDGIVYCPGSINLKPFKSLKIDDFLNDFEGNLLGAVKVINKYFPNLKSAEKASIVLSGRNLLLFTPAENNFIDPESSSYGNDIFSEFGEFRTGPTVRSFTAAIRINF